MTRFAVTIAALEVALTLGAVWFIALIEPPAAGDYLVEDDFRALGPVTKFHRDIAHLPDGETRWQYQADYGPDTHASAEVRIAASRVAFTTQLAEEQATAGRERPAGAVYSVVEEQWFGDHSFTARRLYPGPVMGDASVQIWILHGNTIIIARYRKLAVPRADLQEALRTCERHAQSLARIALGQVWNAEEEAARRGSR